MSLRTRLLGSSALILALLLTVLLVSERALTRLQTAFVQVLTVNEEVDRRADSIGTWLEKARTREQAFIRTKDMAEARENIAATQEITTLATAIKRYAGQHRDRALDAAAGRLLLQARTYAAGFQKLVDANVKRGLTPDQGLRGAFRAAAHELENVHVKEHEIGPLLIEVMRLQRATRELREDAAPERITHLRAAIATFGRRLMRHHTRQVYTDLLRTELDRLQGAFAAYIEADTGAAKKKQAQAMDDALAALTDQLDKIYVPEVLAKVLQIRRHEKDYIMRGGLANINLTYQAIDDLRQAMENSGIDPADAADTLARLDDYKKNFSALLAVDRDIAKLRDNLSTTAARIEQAAADIIRLAEQHERQVKERAFIQARRARRLALAVGAAAVIAALALSLFIIRSITRPLADILAAITRLDQGDDSARATALSRSETGRIAASFNRMAQSIASNNRLTRGQAELAAALRENRPKQETARDAISFLTDYIGAQVGAIYLDDSHGRLRLAEGVALPGDHPPATVIDSGQGLAGEAFRSGTLRRADGLPPDYITLESALGSAPPRHLVAAPLRWQGRNYGVVELASLTPFSDTDLRFLESAGQTIAIAIHTTRQFEATTRLLAESREQAERLRRQQEELKAANEELEEQTQALRASEEELRTQQEELQAANEELEEKTQALEEQQKELKHKNNELRQAWREIDRKARDLETAGRYKSEFMANMSHELRTPLNSLLLLAHNLAANKEGNLDESQVEAARIIHKSGRDLLALINDILDLAKVEAGRMEAEVSAVETGDLADWLRENFLHVADDKGISFTVGTAAGAPERIDSDRRRLEQILRNLAANAIKFTDTGGVTVLFTSPDEGDQEACRRAGINPEGALAIRVSDTGIGIAEDDRESIFEAFKQVEGHAARRYGGTGLGLSISRKLADLLGGTITLSSTPGHGSTFTLLLPRSCPAARGEENPGDTAPPPAAPTASAPAAWPEDTRPEPPPRRVLVVEDDEVMGRRIVDLITPLGVEAVSAANGEEALACLRDQAFACLILDIGLPDISGFRMLERFMEEGGTVPPLIVHTGRDLTENEEGLVRRHAGAVIVKGLKSEERLLDETALFLHRVISDLPPEKHRMIADLHEQDAIFIDKKILVVDDDMRNAFALSRILEDRGMKITIARDGNHALATLEKEDFDLVLMDIMMPSMDGYEAMSRIRAQQRFARLPVIALTAKAMPEDREKCVAAGANDYLSKPVDEERLLSMMRVWLYQ